MATILISRVPLRKALSSNWSGRRRGRHSPSSCGKMGHLSSSISLIRVRRERPIPSYRNATNSAVVPIVGTTFEWTVDLTGQGGNPNFNLSNGHTFFFGIFNSGTTDVFESQYINITSNAVTTSSTTTTTSPTQTSTHTTSSSTTPATTNTNTAAPTSKGLSKGAQAGIGVGVAIVGVALVIGAIVFFLARRRRAANIPPLPPSELPPTEIAKTYYGPPVELPPTIPKYAARPPVELPEQPPSPGVSGSPPAPGIHEL